MSQTPFHPIIQLPAEYDVYDFTVGYDPDRPRRAYGIGRYDELRPGMYTADQFAGVRNIHMGIDIGCPVDTPVHAFDDGRIVCQQDNNRPGDYGPTIVCEHHLDGRPIYLLLGHLSRGSLQLREPGTRFKRGDVVGYVGSKDVNGGWNPHVHIQLAIEKPSTADLPGVVTAADRAAALALYPDPRRILGPIYE